MNICLVHLCLLRKAIMKLRVRRNGIIGDLNILRDGGVKLNITDATTNIFFKFLVRRNGVTGMKTLIQQSDPRI